MSYEVTGAKAPTDAADDRELRFTLEVAGDDDIVFTVDLVDLRAKTPIVEANRAMNDANSVSYVVGTHTYRIGRDTSENFYFGTSAGATYLVTIVDRRVRFKPEMLASGTPDNTKFPRGDGVWAVPVGTGQGIAASAVRAFAKEATSAAAVRQGIVTAMDGPAQDSERLDFLDLKNQPPAVRDFAKTTATAAAVRQGIVTAMDSPAQDSERLSYNDLKDKPTIPSGGGGSSSEIPAGSALPAVADSAVGNKFNLNGVFYELVSGSVDPHIYRGTVAALANGYFGDATFSWQNNSPYGIRAFYSKAAMGASPPATLFAVVDRSDGLHDDINLSRAAGSDTATHYAYTRTAGGASIDGGVAGQTFEVRNYTDHTRATEVRIQSASDNRWEPGDRSSPLWKQAYQANNDFWEPDKLGFELASNPPSVPNDQLFLTRASSFVPLPYGGGMPFESIDANLTLVRTDANAQLATPTGFTPLFDLSDPDNQDGWVSGHLHIRISPTSDANMGFLEGGANQTENDRKLDLYNEVPVSDVRDADEFASTTVLDDLNGVNIHRVNVWSGSTLVGIYTFMIVKVTQNNKPYMAAYYHYDGRAGATGASIFAVFRPAFRKERAAALTGGGAASGAGQGFMLTVPNPSAKNFTTGTDATDPTDGDWSAWTNILTSRALTAAEVGNLLLVGHVHVETNADPTDGGDRIITESRIRRTRGADTVTVSDDLEYGPRNVGGTLPANFRDASQISDKNLVVLDAAETGDVYALEVRAISQKNARRVDIAVAGNWLGIAQLGGGAGGGAGGGGGGVEELFNLDLTYDSSNASNGSLNPAPYALPAFARELTEADDDKSLVLDIAVVHGPGNITVNQTAGRSGSAVFRAGDIRALASDAPPASSLRYVHAFHYTPYDGSAPETMFLDKNADGRLVFLGPANTYLRHARCRLVGGGGGGAAASGGGEEILLAGTEYTGTNARLDQPTFGTLPAFTRDLVAADDAKTLYIDLAVSSLTTSAGYASAPVGSIALRAGDYRELAARAYRGNVNDHAFKGSAFSTTNMEASVVGIDKFTGGLMVLRTNVALYLRYVRVRLVG